MAVIKSRMRRLAAAIGIGLLAESLFLLAGGIVDTKIPAPWGDRLANLTQEPAYHLVNWLAEVQHPGFEGQAGYALLIPLLQWVVWSAVIYLLLSRRAQQRIG